MTRSTAAVPKKRAKRVDLDQELSFPEAAASLGRKDDRGRKLKAMVLARERQTGKKIAIRLNGAARPKLRITIGALSRHFPELVPARTDDLARMVKPVLERLDERTRLMVQTEIRAQVDLRLRNIEKSLKMLTQAVAKLGGN